MSLLVEAVCCKHASTLLSFPAELGAAGVHATQLGLALGRCVRVRAARVHATDPARRLGAQLPGVVEARIL